MWVGVYQLEEKLEEVAFTKDSVMISDTSSPGLICKNAHLTFSSQTDFNNSCVRGSHPAACVRAGVDSSVATGTRRTLDLEPYARLLMENLQKGHLPRPRSW